MNENLEKCPFCGGEARLIEHKFHGLSSSYGVKCSRCEAQTNQFYGHAKTAARAWNRRYKEDDTDDNNRIR